MKCKSIPITATTLLIASLAVLLFSSNASAEKYMQKIHGKEVVVHTNPIPVILHRMVPPQYGRHVTQKEVTRGSVPQPRSAGSIRKR
jgi:hypothetical protein